MRSEHVSAAVAAVAIVGAVAAAVGAGGAVRAVAVTALLAFVVVEARRLPMVPLVSGSALLVAGLVIGGRLDVVVPMVLEGAQRTLSFMVVLGAALTLRHPALQSPAFRKTGEWVVGQPAGRRFLGVAVTGHFLSSALNLAALQFIAYLLERDVDARLFRRLVYASMRGMLAATMWTPFFIGMGAVLAALPSLSWFDLASKGVAISAAMIAFAWAFDRLGGGAPSAPEGGTAPAPEAGGALARIGGLLLFLTAAVITVAETLDVSVLIANGLVAPVVAVAWLVAVGRRSPAPSLGIDALFRDVAERLPGIRNETFVFLGANVFGLGLAAAIEPRMVAELLPFENMALVPRIIAMCVTGSLIGALGVHPIILIVTVGQVLPPEAVGLPSDALGLILLVIWTTGSASSPFSAMSLQMAKILGVSTFTTAWRWNGLYSLAASAFGGLLVSAWYVVP